MENNRLQRDVDEIIVKFDYLLSSLTQEVEDKENKIEQLENLIEKLNDENNDLREQLNNVE